MVGEDHSIEIGETLSIESAVMNGMGCMDCEGRFARQYAVSLAGFSCFGNLLTALLMRLK